ncbi:TonB-dependent hemoglobin/transferrin/lactoferrin family receptor [Vibrio lentus]
MYKQSLLSASIVLALSSTSAFADDYALFDEVVVSSTRTNQQLEDVAASVTVINDKDIEKNMVTDVNDLFKYTPGVTVTTNSRQGIQGINIRGMEGNRVKVIVDGVSQTNQFTPSGTQKYNYINSSRVDVDTDMLKSVEIVKGAASSLYGSDAIGGIAAFETKDPSDFLKGRDFGGHAKFNFSSADNTFSESVAMANRFGDLETLVAYTRRDGENVDSFGSPEEQDTKNNNLLVKLQYQLNEDHRLEFSGNFIENSGETDLIDPAYTNYMGDDTTSQQQVGIKHIWNSELAFADTITWQADWLAKEENGITDRTYVSNGNIQRKDYLYSDEGYQLDFQLDKFFTIGNVENYLIYGASYSDKDIENINNEYNSSSADKIIFYIPGASERKYGFFVQNEMTVGNWMITPGVRFDGFETDPGDATDNPSGNPASDYAKYSDSAITGRLGTTYTLNDENKIFAQVSQGFRAPDFQELYLSYGNPMHGYINIPNPELEAEESISYELGWRHNTDMSSSEIAIFYSDYTNFIDSQVVSDAGVFPQVNQSINIDEAVIKGIEASNTLSWNGFMPVQGVSTRVAATYTEGEDGEGNPLNSVNPWNAVVGFNYDAPSALWGTSLNISYTAGKKSSDINSVGLSDEILPTDSATVVDLTAYYLPIKDLTLRAGLFNVTDEEYYSWNDVRGFSQEDKDYTQAGRNWSVTAKYEF